MRALPYAPYETLEERPHVMVDGAARPSSVLTLSHWPHAPTPPVLARDLSVEIAMAYVRASAGELTCEAADRSALEAALAAGSTAEAVTNDHFDEDGLMSVLCLADPEFALEHEEVLVGVASCGDFGIVRSERAAEIAFAIGPLAELLAGAGAGTSARYLAALDQVRSLIADPGQYRALWHEEMHHYRSGLASLDDGSVEIVELNDDLAMVSDVEGTGALATHRSAGPSGESGSGLPVHAAAVHSRTSASRVLAFSGDRCELYLRYEGWVRFTSRKVTPRPDLGRLAAELTSLEPGSVTWEANPPSAIVPRCRPSGDGVTEIERGVIVDVVSRYLRTAPPEWDPVSAGTEAGRRRRRFLR